MELLSSLNEVQRQAVETTEGPLLVLAGAGSGKTRVITFRIAFLILGKGVLPQNILAVTFTNKAAGEMRERVKLLLSERRQVSAPLISTFHSLCVRILRADIEHLEEGYGKSFTIFDQDDSVKTVRACAKELGLDDQSLSVRSIQSTISNAKNSGVDAETFAAGLLASDERRGKIARIYRLYEEKLRQANALDFDDLMIKAVRLLRRSAAVRDKYNDRFRYILVDEYQDTNGLQFALIRLLTEKEQNICVVGDDDQSIYKWRGADISNILNFEQQFQNAVVIRLEENYRSTQTILNGASAVVQNNKNRKGKKLWTKNPTGELVRYFQAFDADAEARFVVSQLEVHRRREADLRAAILYRTNAQSRILEETLRRNGIAYNIVGGFSFYERAEIKDIIAYLKLALNPDDSIALSRVINSPARGIGRQTLEEIDRWAQKLNVSYWRVIEQIMRANSQESVSNPDDLSFNLSSRGLLSLEGFYRIIHQLRMLVAAGHDRPVSTAVKAAIIDTGYELALRKAATDEALAKIENLQELANAAEEYDTEDGDEENGQGGRESGLQDFIDAAALVSDTDQYKRDAPVTLLTMHSAKGLEFPLVFIIGMEDGLFPHARAANDRAEMEEERRLCYVAMTRAQKYLYVTHAMRRRVYGTEVASEPSQFLNELPSEIIEDLSFGSSWLSPERSLRAEPYRKYAERRHTESNFTGKTYNNPQAIANFLKEREQSPHAADRKKVNSEFIPGSYVRHAKYGRGLVLKRESSSDSYKLTIIFPGYGQKKLVEKFAGLVHD